MAQAAPQVASAGGLGIADAALTAADVVLDRLDSRRAGLTSAEAAERLDRMGPNVIRSHRLRAAAVLGRQFRNPLLLLLLAAAAVSGLTGDPTNALIIAVIVALSVVLGFVNEYRAESAAAELHARIRHEAVVWRDGRQQRLPSAALVPGDVVDVRVGDLVPADARLLEAHELECDEAVLTGESLPVAKSADAATAATGPSATSLVLMGTVVHEGSGRAVVVATGTATAFGRIAVGVSERPTETAFQAGLHGFSRLLVGVAAVLTAGIFVVNVAYHRPLLEALLFSLAIAIGITPTMMPAIVTVSLSRGSRELARRRVLVKRLVAIEDLGNIQLLFTDKTGTLTEGAATFAAALSPAGEPDPAVLAWGLLCNEAAMTDEGPVGGNALDQALWRAPDAATVATAPGGPSSYSRVGVLPFDHERRLLSVVARPPEGPAILVTKGAPESVLPRCATLPPGATATLDRLFAEGARVVAVATRQRPGSAPPSPADEQGLALAGFLTFVDRPKAHAGTSIGALRRLGIDVKVITGDNGTVAVTVCRHLGLEVGGVLTGTDVDALDDEALAAAVPGTTVFARASPDQKSRIIKVARRTGVDVAFLGDGVNDAVALHHADVGISVDSATDVAKDAADVVLLDKDLGILADGVVEGRRIFANTMKYVLMATSSNFGNMFSAAGASLFLTFLPMLPSQILLNNLLYDTGQLAIPTDRVDPEALARPAAWDIGFIRRFMAVFGPISSIFDFLTFAVMLGLLHAGHREFRSGWFVESLATQTLVIYVIRTHRVPFFRSRPSLAMLLLPTACAVVGAVLPFTALGHLLGFATLPPTFFAVLVGMIVTYLALVELAKAWFYAGLRRPVGPPTTSAQRRHRRIRRRAARFSHHHAPRRGPRHVPVRGRFPAAPPTRRPGHGRRPRRRASARRRR